MRSTIIIIASLVLAISCRKDLTCECTYTKNFHPAGGGTGSAFTKKTEVSKSRQKKKEFKEATKCYNTTATQTFTHGTEVVVNNCELK
ncbi:MAG: hypothetical protein IPI93_14055 [Sphingobacteriaceae bacterium]|nr:hypothetical protein [Sphingobacteriaceae bacterium]